MTAIPFVKASACGNDFLIIDAADADGMHSLDRLAAFTRRICDRHNGVGADGVEWLFPTPDADIHARLLNADGSEAEISGNGTRCVAAYLCSENPRDHVNILTGAGIKRCTLTSHNENQFEFEIAMGAPQVSDAFAIEVASREVRGIPVSMGNPHFVVFVDDFAPDWQAKAAEIAKHQDFKQGVNVELVRVRDKENLDVRFYERGVGRNAILWHRIMRFGRSRDFCQARRIPGARARPRWGANGTMGRRSIFARPGAAHLPGRVSDLISLKFHGRS